MQLIDENTYIDDTLVTCAEYQLFIDEMREQGEYYQPDHWTSYQFPAGQAKEAILGVRHSDAEKFCEWLTQRDVAGWHYQLPTDKEAEEYRLKLKHSTLPLGYWIVNADELSRFAWTGTLSVDPRGITHADHISYLVRARERADDRKLTNSFYRDRNHSLVFNRANTIDSAYDRAIIGARDLDFNRVGNKLSFILTRTRDLIRSFPYTLDHDLTLILSRYFDLDHDRNLLINSTLDSVLDLAFDLAFTPDLNFVFGLFFDLYTLQERIAGRSPAFEGIRLVKERIR